MKLLISAASMVAVLMLGPALPSTGAEPFTCPVTVAAPISFTPVGTFAAHRTELFGNENLFTIFPGAWHTAQRTGRGFRVPKIVWGTAAFDLRNEVHQSALTITGRRLDAASGPLQFEQANTAWIDPGYPTGIIPKDNRTPLSNIDRGQFFITSEFYVPTLGCWEVTGHFHDTDLKIVVDLK